MKTLKITLLLIFCLIILTPESKSFAPKGKTFGLGLIIGEPTGLTAKYWLKNNNALAFSIGNSYLGSLRLGMDYLWHFNAFKSALVNMYAGPGLAIGIGESSGWWYKDQNHNWYKTNEDIGLGIRGVLGINFVPKNSPFELFGEVGMMVGALPGFYANFEGAIGGRFYF